MSSPAASQRQARKQLAAAGTSVSPGLGGRVVVRLLLVSIAVIASIGVLIAIEQLHVEWINSKLDATEWWRGRLSLGAVSAAVGIVALNMLWRRGPGATELATNSRHIVEMGDRGVLYVNSASVSALAAAAVRVQPQIIDAEVRVRGGGAGPVRLLIRALVAPGTSLQEVGTAAQVAAKDAASRLAGLEVQDVNIELVVSMPDNLDRILE